MRSIRVRACVVGAGMIALATGVLLLSVLRPSTPEWRRRLNELSLKEMPENPSPRLSREGIERTMYLKNNLRRRDYWGPSEVDEVIAMIEAHPVDAVPVEDVTPDGGWEAYFLARNALSAIRLRIGIGAPIDPAERERLIDILLRYSHAAASSIRLSMAQSLCWSGLIFVDDRVDARVKEMMDDPDPMVASNARSQYRFHSQGRERWEEYQRRLARERK